MIISTNTLTLSFTREGECEADDNLRDLIEYYFGDRYSDTGPLEFLKSKGYTLNSNLRWKAPSHIDGYDGMSSHELECMTFLAEEWGYGWLVFP